MALFSAGLWSIHLKATIFCLLTLIPLSSTRAGLWNASIQGYYLESTSNSTGAITSIDGNSYTFSGDDAQTIVKDSVKGAHAFASSSVNPYVPISLHAKANITLEKFGLPPGSSTNAIAESSASWQDWIKLEYAPSIFLGFDAVYVESNFRINGVLHRNDIFFNSVQSVALVTVSTVMEGDIKTQFERSTSLYTDSTTVNYLWNPITSSYKSGYLVNLSQWQQFEIVLKAYASGGLSSLDFGVYNLNAESDFSHTMELLGFSVYDLDGNPLPANAFVIRSGSGLQYPVLDAGSIPVTSVPEPGSLTLVGLGAIGLVAGAIRRRRQHNVTV